jgi:hypothetical protein
MLTKSLALNALQSRRGMQQDGVVTQLATDIIILQATGLLEQRTVLTDTTNPKLYLKKMKELSQQEADEKG